MTNLRETHTSLPYTNYLPFYPSVLPSRFLPFVHLFYLFINPCTIPNYLLPLPVLLLLLLLFVPLLLFFTMSYYIPSIVPGLSQIVSFINHLIK